MNKEINQKIDEIINEIENSLIYQRYLSLKEKIANNKELMTLINKVRIMQQDVLHHKKTQEELDSLLSELNTNPLYIEYNNTLAEINNIYAIIEINLNSYFTKIMS